MPIDHQEQKEVGGRYTATLYFSPLASSPPYLFAGRFDTDAGLAFYKTRLKRGATTHAGTVQ
jgi:hypothetical protein